MKGQFGNVRIIDKTPMNCLFAGLIASAIPDSRMICLRRGSKDSCYAILKTPFTDKYLFSYHLEELADYYIAWDRLVSHWKQSVGKSWLTVGYEDLVRNPEPTMRELVAHCDLPWSDDFLQFHNLAQPLTSASAGQVNQPINDRSIGLWRRYEAKLAPPAERMSAAGLSLERD
jgi:hypothetical protein